MAAFLTHVRAADPSGLKWALGIQRARSALLPSSEEGEYRIKLRPEHCTVLVRLTCNDELDRPRFVGVFVCAPAREPRCRQRRVPETRGVV